MARRLPHARQLGTAVAARTDRKTRKTSTDPATAFHLHRQTQSRRAGGSSGCCWCRSTPTRPSRCDAPPDVRQAVLEAYGPTHQPTVTTLRDLLGAIGAHEWQKKGVEIPPPSARASTPATACSRRFAANTSTSSPTPPLPSHTQAFDIGTGTGVLAAVLAHRGVEKVIATELDANALACARTNLDRLATPVRSRWWKRICSPTAGHRWSCATRRGFPPDPPRRSSTRSTTRTAGCSADSWPGWPSTSSPGGEGWLILSDIAEHLGLRTREELLTWIEDAGLTVLGRRDVAPPARQGRRPIGCAARRAQAGSDVAVAARCAGPARRVAAGRNGDAVRNGLHVGH